MTIDQPCIRYMGYRCGSITEAQWLVFFDEMGLRYEHKPQGCTIPADTVFRPHLYFRDLNQWAVIASEGSTGDRPRIERLAATTGLPVTLLIGAPTYRRYEELIAILDKNRIYSFHYSVWLDEPWDDVGTGWPGFQIPRFPPKPSDKLIKAIKVARGVSFDFR